MVERKKKRSNLEMKFYILDTIVDGELYSISFIERKLQSSWSSIKEHCKELEIFGAVTSEDSKIRITKKGITFFEEIKKELNSR